MRREGAFTARAVKGGANKRARIFLRRVRNGTCLKCDTCGGQLITVTDHDHGDHGDRRVFPFLRRSRTIAPRPTAPSTSWMQNFRSREAVKGALSARRRRRASPLDRLSASEKDASMRSTALPAELAPFVRRRAASAGARLGTLRELDTWRSLRPIPRPSPPASPRKRGEERAAPCLPLSLAGRGWVRGG